MPDIYDVAEEFANDLLRQERAAALRLVNAYGEAYKRIQAAVMDAARELKDVGVGDLTYLDRQRKLARLQLLRAQVAQEMDTFGRIAVTTITAEQRAALQQGQLDAPELMGLGMGPAPPGIAATFDAVPATAFERLVGFTAAGSPLADLFAELGDDAAQTVTAELQAGLAAGLNPRKIAIRIKRALGGNLTRALLIARTETLRAYRESTRAVYRENADLVSGYQWVASLSLRTCGMCLAMHGTVFKTETPFGTHPNCRCTMVPVMRSWHDLGYDVPEPIEPKLDGEAWFRALDADDQDTILGPLKARAFRDGEFAFDDLIGYRKSPRWGPERWERSLTAILPKRRRGHTG